MRLTNRDKEIPLVCSANDRFWTNVYEKLAKYEDAETNGLLVRLPCRVGDTLFFAQVETVNDEPRNTVHLCASCEYQYPDCPADEGVVFGCGKGNDNICQCPEYVAKTPRWISVEERLPEELFVVLCYCSRNGQCECGEWTRDDHNRVCWIGLNGMIPTHWMLLPMPPKEET